MLKKLVKMSVFLTLKYRKLQHRYGSPFRWSFLYFYFFVFIPNFAKELLPTNYQIKWLWKRKLCAYPDLKMNVGGPKEGPMHTNTQNSAHTHTHKTAHSKAPRHSYITYIIHGVSIGQPAQMISYKLVRNLMIIPAIKSWILRQRNSIRLKYCKNI